MVIVWFCCVHDLRKDPQVRAMHMDTDPETRPRSATVCSTHSYGKCDAHHSNDPVYYGCRYFCSSRDADRISCRSGRSSRVELRWAHVRGCRGNLGRTRRPWVQRYSRQVAGLRASRPSVPPRCRILRSPGRAGVQVGSIVMPLSPPRYLARRTGGTAPAPPVPGDGARVRAAERSGGAVDSTEGGDGLAVTGTAGVTSSSCA